MDGTIIDIMGRTPGVWGVNFIGDDCLLFETEEEARDYYNSLAEDSVYSDGEGVELFKVINEDGDTEVVDSKVICESTNKIKKSGKKLTEAADNFDNIDFSHPEANSTSYWAYIENKHTGHIIKSDERNHCSGPNALRHILAFMNKELTTKNKDCFGLSWTWDVDALVDDSSDIVVSVATKPEMELEDITERYTFNVDEAAKYIIDTLENIK